MDIQTTSYIQEHSWAPVRSAYKLVLLQRFTDSTFGTFITMYISKEISHRLTAMLHLDEDENLAGQEVFCLVEDKNSFTVEFELGGCFPAETMKKAFPKTTTICGVQPKKASGLASLFLHNPSEPNGTYFFEEYFLSEKYFNDLDEACYKDGSSTLQGHEITIHETGRCYCKISLPAEEITAETIFIEPPKVPAPALPPTPEDFFRGK